VLTSECLGGQVDGTNRVFTAALRSPKGNLTWMILNDAPRSWTARFSITGTNAQSFYQYQVTSADRDQPNLEINPVHRISLRKDQETFPSILPPMSLTNFSTFNLRHSDRGIIVD
jgi:hypothetical protein